MSSSAQVWPAAIPTHAEAGFRRLGAFSCLCQPLADCAVQAHDVVDSKASVLQFVVIDEVDAVKSALRVLVFLSNRIIASDDGCCRALVGVQRCGHLDLPSGKVVSQLDPKVAVNVAH